MIRDNQKFSVFQDWVILSDNKWFPVFFKNVRLLYLIFF